jgi:hypothetical protein
MCGEYKWGAKKHMRWEKLRINVFLWVFSPNFQVDTTMGLRPNYPLGHGATFTSNWFY